MTASTPPRKISARRTAHTRSTSPTSTPTTCTELHRTQPRLRQHSPAAHAVRRRGIPRSGLIRRRPQLPRVFVRCAEIRSAKQPNGSVYDGRSRRDSARPTSSGLGGLKNRGGERNANRGVVGGVQDDDVSEDDGPFAADSEDEFVGVGLHCLGRDYLVPGAFGGVFVEEGVD